MSKTLISVLLFSGGTALFAQNAPEPEGQLLFLNISTSSPMEALVNSADLQTQGKGYRNTGTRFSASHCMMHQNQGFIQTLFYTSNSFRSDAFAQDNTQDVSPSIAAGGVWKTFGILTGYYRQFPLNAKQSFLLDMTIQAGLIYGNSPSTELRYDYSPNEYRDIMTEESWGSGMMGLTGFGLNFKPASDYGLRLGLDGTVGQIQHVAERTEQNFNFSPYTNTTEKAATVIPTQYWTLNVNFALRIRL
jgi:hypothetical protein